MLNDAWTLAKADAPKVGGVAGSNVIRVRDTQREKQESPILVTLSGKIIEVRDVQL